MANILSQSDFTKSYRAFEEIDFKIEKRDSLMCATQKLNVRL